MVTVIIGASRTNSTKAVTTPSTPSFHHIRALASCMRRVLCTRTKSDFKLRHYRRAPLLSSRKAACRRLRRRSMAEPLRIGIAGALGRMGQANAAALEGRLDATVNLGFDLPGTEGRPW